MDARNESTSSALVGHSSEGTPETTERLYERACLRAQAGNLVEAQWLYESLRKSDLSPRLAALITNDLATLDLLKEKPIEAERGFLEALERDPSCQPARQNLAMLRSESRLDNHASHLTATSRDHQSAPIYEPPAKQDATASKTKVAILSLLFNWPSTGGGTIHTAETGKFLSAAGYEVRHFYAQHADWGLGRVDEPLSYQADPIRFEDSAWNADEIRTRFRAAVDEFGPDYVIVTDSWNTKPLLAEAVTGYPYFLRLAALECLCPLNNVRLLFDKQGVISACPRNQLATPDVCRECVVQRNRLSGALHRAERSLAGFAESDYVERLRRAVAEAEAVLVVNPLIEQMVSPFAQRVEVIPSGFDPTRFPWPRSEERSPTAVKQIFFAGLVEEHMKGFHVLQEACRLLWQKRQDFELVATADPPDSVTEFTRYIGWQSQTDLPAAMQAAEMLVFPTVAEEALGRSAVEAMGVGRPVVASRIGGLQFTVVDEATGLLFEPGDAADLAAKIERLLNDRELAQRLGKAGRQRFEEHYTWDVIIKRHYRRLLGTPQRTPAHA